MQDDNSPVLCPWCFGDGDDEDGRECPVCQGKGVVPPDHVPACLHPAPTAHPTGGCPAANGR